MLSRSYLSKSFHNYYVLGLLLALFTGHGKTLLGGILIYAALLYLYRRDPKRHTDLEQVPDNVILAPINGKVVSIERNVHHPAYGDHFTKATLFCHWKEEAGVYLPLASEIKEFVINRADSHEFQGLLNYKALKSPQVKSIGVVFTDKFQHKIILGFRRRRFGLWPRLWMMPGDRGKRGANIGHFPFGGKVSLYLPENYEILISESTTIQAAVTVLAGLPRG